MRLVLLVAVIFASTSLMASDTAPSGIESSLNTLWTLIAAFMVFFMQAGFALVESGFTRAKNAVNIVMKNLMDFSIGSIVYAFVGFALMFGMNVLGANPLKADGAWTFAFWLFQVAFAGTAATIVSGSMSERTRFPAYLFCSAFITAFIYPVVGRWIWGGGWLAKLGMVDFAGSTVVHSVGGWAALMGAYMLGPRLGKYNRDGTSNAIPGHNIPLAALGVFILWFGWFGFNAGSTLSATTRGLGMIAVNTNLAAAAGAMSAMVTVWLKHGKPDASMTLNGALAGLVGITAPCALVSPVSAMVIGAVAGVLVVLSVEFIDRVLKVDDPVGAVSVHGVCGAWGTVAVGLFAQPIYSEASGLGKITGLLFGGGWHQLMVQALGVVSVFVWTTLTSLAVFWIAKKTIGLRVSRDEELKGLDIEEHGMESYAGFEIFTTQ